MSIPPVNNSQAPATDSHFEPSQKPQSPINAAIAAIGLPPSAIVPTQPQRLNFKSHQPNTQPHRSAQDHSPASTVIVPTITSSEDSQNTQGDEPQLHRTERLRPRDFEARRS